MRRGRRAIQRSSGRGAGRRDQRPEAASAAARKRPAADGGGPGPRRGDPDRADAAIDPGDSYPASNRRIVVVADNCSDRTAAVVRAAGIEVWERVEPLERGKRYALEWGFSRLLDDSWVQAVCVIDADCEISPNLLSALAARLGGRAEAVQAPYLISNADASDAAALRWAGFALFNVVRPLGCDRLGLSSGLAGTGMAFSRGLLLRSPWRAFSYAEDREQHMRWVLDGARVEFAPEA